MTYVILVMYVLRYVYLYSWEWFSFRKGWSFLSECQVRVHVAVSEMPTLQNEERSASVEGLVSLLGWL